MPVQSTRDGAHCARGVASGQRMFEHVMLSQVRALSPCKPWAMTVRAAAETSFGH